jgi:hypothetical protein
MTTSKRFRRGSVLAVAAVTVLAGAGLASANVPVTVVSTDPFTNPTSQHATEVEPDTFANGNTVISAFQVGRFFNGGASGIGFARSGDGGVTWDTPGFLPGLTFNSGAADSPFERVSDPTVAYDARHGVWLISSLPLFPDSSSPNVFVSRSTDDGRTWSLPRKIPQPLVKDPAKDVNVDKNWTGCDNHPSSLFYGHCYTEFDNFGQNDLVLMSTSADGGLTWSTPVPTAGKDKGIGGQPVVLPNGTAVVPYFDLNQKIAAFISTNGGVSWTKSVDVWKVQTHTVGGGLRANPSFPSVEIDAAGKIYAAWFDCSFRQNCSTNDIVFSTSTDGVNWTSPAVIPIDPGTNTVDHFIPGLAVDPTTSGNSAHLALTYHFYPNANCDISSCQLEVGYISSPDGGAHWGLPIQLAGPMSLTDIAQTTSGPMVGDYISTSFAAGRATTVFAIGRPRPTPTSFDQAMNAPTTPLPVATPGQANRPSTTNDAVVPPSDVTLPPILVR